MRNMVEQPEFHPSFPQPDDTGQVIWRYMDSNKFEWMLEHGRLFMSTADNLGDPREGSTPPGYIAWWQRESDAASSEEQRETIVHNRQFFAYFVPLLRKRYYVSCWHMNNHENHAMWYCYAKTTESVAISTTYRVLRAELPIEALMGIVRYIDYSTDRLPWGNMFEYIMHKDVAYGYEAETRAVVMPPPTKELGLDKFIADHFCLASDPDILFYAPKVDLKSLIQGITLHPEAPDDFVAKVRASCLTKGLPEPRLSRETTKPVY